MQYTGASNRLSRGSVCQQQQPTLASMWQPMLAPPEVAVPKGTWWVPYECLNHEESALLNQPAPPDNLNENKSLAVPGKMVTFARTCDVCFENGPLYDLSTLPSDKLWRLGRSPRQTHQCDSCGITVHRACYGISSCLLKDSVLKESTRAPELPLIPALVEKMLSPPGTLHCRFLCDACIMLHTATNTRHALSAESPLQLLPLEGRCIFCGSNQGPRKVVHMKDAVTLPPIALAHVFCLLSTTPGAVHVASWKILSDITVDEGVLTARRNALSRLLNRPPVCGVCRTEGVANMGLEICKDATPSQPQPCSQPVHPICVRNFVNEYEARDDPTYSHGFESAIALRFLPHISEQPITSFGVTRCLGHAYQAGHTRGPNSDGPLDSSTLRQKFCVICGDKNAPLHHGQALPPGLWCSCKVCGNPFHAACADLKNELRDNFGMCPKCWECRDAYQALSTEWKSATLDFSDDRSHPPINEHQPATTVNIALRAKISLARHRLLCDKFSSSLTATLQSTKKMPNPILKGPVADPLQLIIATVFFGSSVAATRWQTPVPVSLSTFLLLKTLTSKRQTEWVLATTSESPPAAPHGHILLSSSSAGLYPLSEWISPKSGNVIVPDATVKKRIVMKKRAPAPASVSAAGDPESNVSKRLTLVAAKKGSITSTLTTATVVETEAQRKKRKLGETATSKPVNKQKTKPVRGLTSCTSIFSQLLLSGLIPLIPQYSPMERNFVERVQDFTYQVTQLICEILASTYSPNSDAVESLVFTALKAEVLRRASLAYNPSIMKDIGVGVTEEAFIARASGAQWLRSLQTLGKNIDVRLTEAFQSSQINSSVSQLSRLTPCLTLALSLSYELELVRWLSNVSLLRMVIARRLSFFNDMDSSVAATTTEGGDTRTDLPKIPTNRTCFSFKELRSIQAMLAETVPALVACVEKSGPCGLEEQLGRFAGLLRTVRQSLTQAEITVLHNHQRAALLPFPFFSSLAQYFESTRGTDGIIPSILLPPCLTFHVAHGAKVTEGPFAAVDDEIANLSAIVLNANTCLAETPKNLDKLRSVMGAIEQQKVPRDAEDVNRVAELVKTELENGIMVETVAENLKRDFKSLKVFVKVMDLGEELSNDTKPLIPTDSFSLIPEGVIPFAGMYTSEKLVSLLSLSAKVDNWRRELAKLKATALTAPRKKMKALKMTAGGNVKLSGESGFLSRMPNTESSSFEPSTASVKLVDAFCLLKSGEALGVQIPELISLQEDIAKCFAYEMDSRSFMDSLKDMPVWKLFSPHLSDIGALRMENPSLFEFSEGAQHPSIPSLLYRLVDTKPPCAKCMIKSISKPFGIMREFRSLPFIIETNDHPVYQAVLETVKWFCVAWNSLLTSSLTTSSPSVPFNLVQGHSPPSSTLRMAANVSESVGFDETHEATITQQLNNLGNSIPKWMSMLADVLSVLQCTGSHDDDYQYPEIADEIERNITRVLSITETLFVSVVQRRLPLQLIVTILAAPIPDFVVPSQVWRLLEMRPVDQAEHPEFEQLLMMFTHICRQMPLSMLRQDYASTGSVIRKSARSELDTQTTDAAISDDMENIESVSEPTACPPHVEVVGLSSQEVLCSQAAKFLACLDEPQWQFADRWAFVALGMMLAVAAVYSSSIALLDTHFASSQFQTDWRLWLIECIRKICNVRHEVTNSEIFILPEEVMGALSEEDAYENFKIPLPAKPLQILCGRSLSFAAIFSYFLLNDDDAEHDALFSLMGMNHRELADASFDGSHDAIKHLFSGDVDSLYEDASDDRKDSVSARHLLPGKQTAFDANLFFLLLRKTWRGRAQKTFDDVLSIMKQSDCIVEYDAHLDSLRSHVDEYKKFEFPSDDERTLVAKIASFLRESDLRALLITNALHYFLTNTLPSQKDNQAPPGTPCTATNTPTRDSSTTSMNLESECTESPDMAGMTPVEAYESGRWCTENSAEMWRQQILPEGLVLRSSDVSTVEEICVQLCSAPSGYGSLGIKLEKKSLWSLCTSSCRLVNTPTSTSYVSPSTKVQRGRLPQDQIKEMSGVESVSRSFSIKEVVSGIADSAPVLLESLLKPQTPHFLPTSSPFSLCAFVDSANFAWHACLAGVDLQAVASTAYFRGWHGLIKRKRDSARTERNSSLTIDQMLSEAREFTQECDVRIDVLDFLLNLTMPTMQQDGDKDVDDILECIPFCDSANGLRMALALSREHAGALRQLCMALLPRPPIHDITDEAEQTMGGSFATFLSEGRAETVKLTIPHSTMALKVTTDDSPHGSTGQTHTYNSSMLSEEQKTEGSHTWPLKTSNGLEASSPLGVATDEILGAGHECTTALGTRVLQAGSRSRDSPQEEGSLDESSLNDDYEKISFAQNLGCVPIAPTAREEEEGCVAENDEGEIVEDGEESEHKEELAFCLEWPARSYTAMYQAVNRLHELKKRLLLSAATSSNFILNRDLTEAVTCGDDLAFAGVLLLEAKRTLLSIATHQAPLPRQPMLPSSVTCSDVAISAVVRETFIRNTLVKPTGAAEIVRSWAQCAEMHSSTAPIPSIDVIMSDLPAELAHENSNFTPDRVVMLPFGQHEIPHESVSIVHQVEQCIAAIANTDTHLLHIITGESGGEPVTLGTNSISTQAPHSHERSIRTPQVVGAKLLFSLLHKEIFLLALALDNNRIVFVHPLWLLTLAEVGTIPKNVASLIPQCELATTRFPQSVQVFVKFLTLRLPLQAASIIPYAQAVQVLRDVEALVASPAFPQELSDTCRRMLALQINQQIAVKLRNVCLKEAHAVTGGSALWEQIIQTNGVFNAKPLRLHFTDLSVFQTQIQAYEPLVAHVTSILASSEATTTLQAAQDAADQLVHATRVNHPVFEQLAMYIEDVRATTSTVASILVKHGDFVTKLVANGRSIHQTHWNYRQQWLAQTPLKSSERRNPPPMSSTELLLYLFDFGDLIRTPNKCKMTTNTLKTLAASFRRLNPIRPDPLGTPFDALKDAVHIVETHLTDALKEIKSSPRDAALPFALLTKLFVLPAEAWQLLIADERTASVVLPPQRPDFLTLLGFPYPYPVMEPVAFPMLDISRAITSWTCFAIYEMLHLIEKHEALFGTNFDSAVNMSAPVSTNGVGSPIWCSSVEALLPQMVALLPLCISLRQSEGGDLWWKSFYVIRLLRWQRKFSTRRAATENLLPSNRVRDLGVETDLGETSWLMEILASFPRAVDAVIAFLQSTDFARHLMRCVWECLTLILPCKGDPFNLSSAQKLTYSSHAAALCLPPLASTVHKLFTAGKAMLREAQERPNTSTLQLLPLVPPCLHPELRSFAARQEMSGDATFTPWTLRAERLLDSLRSTLQFGKITLSESRKSPETLCTQLILDGVCSPMVVTDDIATATTRVEAKYNCQVQVSDAYDAEKTRPGVDALKKLSHGHRLEACEVYRTSFVSSCVLPSISIPNISRRGNPICLINLRSEFVNWVESAQRQLVTQEATAQCRERLPLPDSLVDFFDLQMKYLSTCTSAKDLAFPTNASAALRVATTPVSADDMLDVFGRGPWARDIELLITVGVHCVMSPFKLTLLRHPMTRRKTKVVYPSMFAYVEFLQFTSQAMDPMHDALQMGEVLYGPSEGVAKLLCTRLSSYLSVKSLVADDGSSRPDALSALLPSTLQSCNTLQTCNSANSTVADRERADWVSLFPQLTDRVEENDIDDEGASSRMRTMESELSQNGSVWWGPTIFEGRTLGDTRIPHVCLVSLTDENNSDALKALFKGVKSFRRIPLLREDDVLVDGRVTLRKKCSESADPSDIQTPSIVPPVVITCDEADEDEEKELGELAETALPEGGEAEASSTESPKEFTRSAFHAASCAFGVNDISSLCDACLHMLFSESKLRPTEPLSGDTCLSQTECRAPTPPSLIANRQYSSLLAPQVRMPQPPGGIICDSVNHLSMGTHFEAPFSPSRLDGIVSEIPPCPSLANLSPANLGGPPLIAECPIPFTSESTRDTPDGANSTTKSNDYAPWLGKVRVPSGFSIYREQQNTSRLKNGLRFLAPLLPLRIPVAVLSDDPQTLITEIFPEYRAIDCESKTCAVDKETMSPQTMLAKVVNICRLDANIGEPLQQINPFLRVRLFMSALPYPWSAGNEDGRSKHHTGTKAGVFGMLVCYDVRDVPVSTSQLRELNLKGSQRHFHTIPTSEGMTNFDGVTSATNAVLQAVAQMHTLLAKSEPVLQTRRSTPQDPLSLPTLAPFTGHSFGNEPSSEPVVTTEVTCACHDIRPVLLTCTSTGITNSYRVDGETSPVK